MIFISTILCNKLKVTKKIRETIISCLEGKRVADITNVMDIVESI